MDLYLIYGGIMVDLVDLVDLRWNDIRFIVIVDF